MDLIHYDYVVLRRYLQLTTYKKLLISHLADRSFYLSVSFLDVSFVRHYISLLCEGVLLLLNASSALLLGIQNRSLPNLIS